MRGIRPMRRNDKYNSKGPEPAKAYARPAKIYVEFNERKKGKRPNKALNRYDIEQESALRLTIWPGHGPASRYR